MRGYVNSQEELVILKNLFRYATILSHEINHVSTGGSDNERVSTAYGFTNYSRKTLRKNFFSIPRFE